MLRQVTCDKFKTQPKAFQAGLNVVLGSSDGSNAIGKSIFLMILDFVFGGDDYVKNAKDVIAHIGHHTINCEFELSDERYFFSRNTSRPSVVNRCNSTFDIIDDMRVPEYHEWLRDEYGIHLSDISFSEAVGHFFRIYGNSNHNEHRPLQAGREPLALSVERLMKLMGRYADLGNLKSVEEKYGIFPSAKTERSISSISADIAANNEILDELIKRRERLSRQNEEADLRILGIDTKNIEHLTDIKNRLVRLNRHKSRLLSQLNAIRNNMPDNSGVSHKDFSELLSFFPNANIAALSNVESFHEKITEFLKADIEREINKVTPQIELISKDIDIYEKQIVASGIAKKLSQSILTQYASIVREIRNIEEKNSELQKEMEQVNKRKEIEQMLSALRRKHERTLSEVQDVINATMTRINDIITLSSRTAPILTINPDKSFEYETTDDKSEGTTFKNLVVYDLAMLELTPLPILIHDSSIVKRIEDSDFEQILSLYRDSGNLGKQVFIAFDKADTCTPKASQMLEDSTVLNLSTDNVLFGTSWSRMNKETESYGGNQ